MKHLQGPLGRSCLFETHLEMLMKKKSPGMDVGENRNSLETKTWLLDDVPGCLQKMYLNHVPSAFLERLILSSRTKVHSFRRWNGLERLHCSNYFDQIQCSLTSTCLKMVNVMFPHKAPYLPVGSDLLYRSVRLTHSFGAHWSLSKRRFENFAEMRFQKFWHS